MPLVAQYKKTTIFPVKIKYIATVICFIVFLTIEDYQYPSSNTK